VTGRARAVPAAGTVAAAVALPAVLTACGSAGGSAASAAAAALPPLAATVTGPGGAEGAIVVMGGTAARHNNYWQLFVRPAASSRWLLETPPGTADNGGLMAATTATTLAVGFGGSQLLKFSPVAVTGDGGAHWAQAAPVYPGLAASASALAAGPGGQALALTRTGQVALTARLAGQAAGWKVITTQRVLAATPAGRACGLARLTAVAFAPGGAPLVGGSCTRPGVAGLFTRSGGRWQAAGPALAGAAARGRVTVLRLQAAGDRASALLRAGSGRSAAVLAATTTAGTATASSPGGAVRWRLSASQPAGTARMVFASVSPGGSAGLVRAGNRGSWLAAPGGSWRRLPALPAGTQALAPGPAGQLDAIAAAGNNMTTWRLDSGTRAWARVQRLHVPIPYGSSG
jgi:hypothetical protein